MATKIHPTAVVSHGAELGRDVEIGPYTLIGPHVTVGDRTKIGAQVVVDGVTTIGEDNLIVGQASLGGPPQDLSYKREPTRLEIGDRNTIREFVTVNCGTIKGGGVTRIGNDCLLMACSHVAHDCELKDRVLLGNNVLLAGHVLVEERVNISGGAAAHHFVTIGTLAYIGGLTRLIRDVPPYVVVEGNPSKVRKINRVGLERAGYAQDDIEPLRSAYRRLFRSRNRPLIETITEMREQGPTTLVERQLASLENTLRGNQGRYRETLREAFAREGASRILEQPSASASASATT
jgi:UDP-N-acetylglucosamine acyltransferase